MNAILCVSCSYIVRYKQGMHLTVTSLTQFRRDEAMACSAITLFFLMRVCVSLITVHSNLASVREMPQLKLI